MAEKERSCAHICRGRNDNYAGHADSGQKMLQAEMNVFKAFIPLFSGMPKKEKKEES